MNTCGFWDAPAQTCAQVPRTCNACAEAHASLQRMLLTSHAPNTEAQARPAAHAPVRRAVNASVCAFAAQELTEASRASCTSNHVIGCRALYQAPQMPIVDQYCKLKAFTLRYI